MASDYTESRSADYADSPDTLWGFAGGWCLATWELRLRTAREVTRNGEGPWIENVPAGWQARETYRLEATGELVEVFELAEPGKEFTVYSETRLRRVSP